MYCSLSLCSFLFLLLFLEISFEKTPKSGARFLFLAKTGRAHCFCRLARAFYFGARPFIFWRGLDT